jgi:hypothetical protein
MLIIWHLTLLLSAALLLLLASSAWFTMHYLYSFPALFSFASAVSAAPSATASSTTLDLSWHAPPSTEVSDLKSVINGTDVYGFIFNSSKTPAGLPYCKLGRTFPVWSTWSNNGRDVSMPHKYPRKSRALFTRSPTP